MSNDTVFNQGMRVVFSDEAHVVKRRLKAKFPPEWEKVCIGETGKIVTITEYLYEDKYREVVEMIKGLMHKQDLAMYKRNPERLEIYIESTAKKIIERVLRD